MEENDNEKVSWEDLGLEEKDQITNVIPSIIFKFKRLSKFVIQKIKVLLTLTI
jgi:hypothetical protein